MRMSGGFCALSLASSKQGQSYTFEPSTTLFVPRVCFYICFQTFVVLQFDDTCYVYHECRCKTISLSFVFNSLNTSLR